MAGAAPACPRRRHYLGAAVAMTLVAVYGSLVPLNYRPLDFQEALRRFAQVPFLSLGIESRADWVANILLFIPIGFGWLGAVAVDSRRVAWKCLAAGLVATGCAVLSVLLEFTQLWFPPRTVSQNDILAEMIGGMIGAILWLAVGQALTDWVRTYTSASRVKTQVDWLLEAYFLGLLVYSVMPLDLTISPEELVEKYRQGKIVLVPYAGMPRGFELAYALFCNFLLFAPVGILVTTWRTSARRPCRRIVASVAIAAAVALGIEAAQLLVYSRFSTTGDVITDTAGAIVGILAAHWWYRSAKQGGEGQEKTPSGAGWMVAWLITAALYAVLLVVVFSAPFEILHDRQQWKLRYEGFWTVPFARLYYGTEFHALSQILRKVLFFVPLGSLLAAAGFAPRLPAAIRRLFLTFLLLLAAGLAVAIELGQVFLVGHYADSTDAALYTTGTAVGMLVAARLLRHRGQPAPHLQKHQGLAVNARQDERPLRNCE